jgi:hypothetical protein
LASRVLKRTTVKEVSMEMFVTLIALSVVGTLVGAILLVAAAQPSAPPAVDKSMPVTLPAPRFFVEDLPEASTQVPIEVLLLQIERHVRLEQAAAESFVDLHTRELLHSRTASPLLVH